MRFHQRSARLGPSDHAHAVLMRGDVERVADNRRGALHAELLRLDVVGLEVEKIVGLTGPRARNHTHGVPGHRRPALRKDARHAGSHIPADFASTAL